MLLQQVPFHQNNLSAAPGPSDGHVSPLFSSLQQLAPVASSPTTQLQRQTELLRALMPIAYDTTVIDIGNQHENFPLVTTWKTGKKADGYSTLGQKIKFLMYDTGLLVEEGRVNTMRADLRNIFQQILKYLPEALEATWTGHDIAF